jgi:NADPH-dependent 2,4-dienoyl-CoA reductase/sulfur reductase-like enzyme
LLVSLLGVATALAAESSSADLVIYGGTPAGVAAAVQAAADGAKVILLEPGPQLGGLTTGGLGASDVGDKRMVGGIAREFYRRIHDY